MRVLFLIICVFLTGNCFAQKETSKTIEKSVNADHLVINYTFSNSELLQKEPEITEILEKGFKAYNNLFEGNPRDTLDIEYTEFAVQIKQSSYPGGGADPKAISINFFDYTLFGYANWKTALLHELMHLWNGESFKYKNGKEYWFSEGFSDFYTYQTATKLKIISPEDALSISTLQIGYYISSLSLGKISIREAGKDDKTKIENYFLVYNGGWTIAMLLDVDIRTKTGNKKSLDDLMKWLYKNFKKTERLYNMDDLIEGLKVTTGLDYQSFFLNYINGTKTIPVSDYFDIGKASWDLKFNTKTKPKHSYLYKSLGIE